MFIARPRLLPTLDELLQIAIVQTDFVGDLDPDTLRMDAFNTAYRAAEIWEEDHGYPDNTAVGPIPLQLLLDVRVALIGHGSDIINQRQEDARCTEHALERDNSDWFPQPRRSV